MTSHDLEDFLIDRNLSEDEIRATISPVFSVSPIDVLVINDIAEAKVDKNIRIICERLPVKGDFLTRVCVYLHDSKLTKPTPTLTISQFCCILHCKCLISDDSVNPYSMLLVQESENIQLISLEPKRLNKDEEYIMIE
ncbi:MAG: hypothetical protein KME05_06715 [Gloeocapsa sp. UFS-A4-WI-NPMV-4B04]|jgi:hypothetical protein|nr:hypothetical protein [Gloeocapsa sp. UFS-A4-WI-NPMV-4B04]